MPATLPRSPRDFACFGTTPQPSWRSFPNFRISGFIHRNYTDRFVVGKLGVSRRRLSGVSGRHANIATHGRGAVAQLVDEVRALPPGSRKQIEERMRAYFDLVRGTLRELQVAGRLRKVDPTVATFGLIGTILWLPRWFRQNGRLSQEAVAKQIANIALGGLLEPTPSRRPASRAAKGSAVRKALRRPRRAKARHRT